MTSRSLRCALHVHSTYSDGEFTLGELRDVFVADGVDVVCMADHAEYFDEGRVATYVRELDACSDDRILFIPGLEFNCADRMHILGYGVTALVESEDPQVVITHVVKSGCVCVVAHPKDTHFERIEAFAVLPDGIETWNSKYDGRYAPRPATFALLRRMQSRKPAMRAFYGLDLHWKKQFRLLTTRLTAASRSREAILGALREGAFVGEKGELELSSSGTLDATIEERFARTHARSSAMKKTLKRAKEMTGWIGRNVPEPIKAQLRRLF